MGSILGTGGLSAEFYKLLWNLGQDLLDVFKASLCFGSLPTSSTRAVLSLLPKKRRSWSGAKLET